jgi:hypothetical protein
VAPNCEYINLPRPPIGVDDPSHPSYHNRDRDPGNYTQQGRDDSGKRERDNYHRGNYGQRDRDNYTEREPAPYYYSPRDQVSGDREGQSQRPETRKRRRNSVRRNSVSNSGLIYPRVVRAATAGLQAAGLEALRISAEPGRQDGSDSNGARMFKVAIPAALEAFSHGNGSGSGTARRSKRRSGVEMPGAAFDDLLEELGKSFRETFIDSRRRRREEERGGVDERWGPSERTWTFAAAPAGRRREGRRW